MKTVKPERVLPPGVFALHPEGTRNSIFWAHTLSVDLAKELGDDQPFFFVTLTTLDFALLGETPTLQDLAACLVSKILTTQPKGPYNIGGVCIGSVLAYEIASQLRTAGNEVSLLVLLDAPSQPYLGSCSSLSGRFSHPRQLLRRVAQLGLRRSLVNLCKRPLKHLPRVKAKFTRTERSVAHELIEAAAFAYHPEKYEGKVLLMLAIERDPYLNFLPGWEAVISSNRLYTQFVNGHHRELIRPQNVRNIADVISSHLLSTPGEKLESCVAGSPSGSSKNNQQSKFRPFRAENLTGLLDS
jgi:thioesterase domain-containing protein